MKKNKNISTFNMFLELWKSLSTRRHYQVASLLIIMILSCFAEALTLASIVPLIKYINNSTLSETNQTILLKPLILLLSLLGNNSSLLIISIYFITLVIICSFIRVLNIYLNTRISASIGSDLSCKVYEKNLYQPYIVQTSKRSSDIIVNTTSQVKETVGVINAILNLITSLLIIIGLLFALISVNWILTLYLFVIFSSTYILFGYTIRKRLLSNSKKIALRSKSQVKLIQEGLGSIRDIILDGSQKKYIKSFKSLDYPMRKMIGEGIFLSTVPKSIIEALGILALASTPIFYKLLGGNTSEILPGIATLAFGSQRLLPALQSAYSCWVSIKSNFAPVQDVTESIKQKVPTYEYTYNYNPYHFQKKIELSSVYFKYSNSSNLILEDINFCISPGEYIGIIGKTGSGKSTLVDIIMGLLKPTKGIIKVDNKELYSKSNNSIIKSWRASISHVPQSIYLIDGTIAENIALARANKEIDYELIEYVSTIAQLSNFVRELPDQYQTNIGERGVKLSGGQRQRIGIARALYKRSSILILDEATSALDNQTESNLMKSLNDSYSNDTTIISIAHRLTSLNQCKRFIKIDSGRIVEDNHV